MRGIIYGLGLLALGITILGATIIAIGTENILNALSTLSLPLIAIFIILHMATVALAAYRWKVVLKALSYKFNFSELFSYHLIGFCIGYITPVGRIGGAPAKMLLINRKGVPYEKGLASTLLDSILENTLDVIFATVLILIFIIDLPFLNIPDLHIPVKWRFIVLLGIAVMGALIFVFYYRMLTKKSVFYSIARITHLTRIPLFSWSEKKLHELDNTFSWFIRNRPKELGMIILISALTWGILLAQYSVALLAIGQQPKFFEVVMIMAVLAIVSVTPVPAGIGVLEFGQAGIFLLLGLDPSIGIAFAILIRLRDFFTTSLGALFLLQIGVGMLNFIPQKK